MIDLQKLSEPFKPEEIEWRVGSTTKDKSKGLALAYIDARHVMDRLDSVVGPENWQCRYNHAGSKTCCEIGINLSEWVWKADGAGDTDIEGSKGAFSDAFKRAAVRWGIGRYLYHLDSPWVALKQRGNSYAIADEELPRLRRLLGQAPEPLPKPAPPSEPEPSSETQRLKDLGTSICRAIKTTTRKDELEDLVAAHREDLEDIEKASKKAYDHIMGISAKQYGKFEEEMAGAP